MNAPTLFGLTNQKGQDVIPCSPWVFEPSFPKKRFTDKAAFRAWSGASGTKHLFYSGFEGTNPHQRVNLANPPVKIHGLVVDYDAAVTDAILKDRGVPDYGPTGVSRTFSGGARLVFMFEKPVFSYSAEMTKRFLERAAKELDLQALLPGFDKAAYLQANKYYEVGRDWQWSEDEIVPYTVVQSWVIETSERANWQGLGVVIPIEEVAAEVERQYPGRWSGDFLVGARGLRFWDSTANTQNAAIIRETGVQCFTGPQPFVTWLDILGAKFVNAFKADRVAGSIEGVFWDSRDYWQSDPRGQWVSLNQQNMGKHLAVKKGLSMDRQGADTFTEVDRALVHIQDHNRVQGAVPFVHQPLGVVWQQNRRFLNTSMAVVMAPEEEPAAWGERFPWLASFFDSFFDPPESKDYFLAWLQRYYLTAAERDLQPGQALFFAGDSNQGKTLLSTHILGEIFGGHQDASNYLLGETQFNKELFESALWTIDDTLPAADSKKHAQFSAMVKKLVANRTFEYHAKFRDAQSVPWIGRVVVTCNADVESIRILPDMEMSTLDKISLFRVKTVKDRNFPANLHKVIKSELPAFLRWLSDWQVPDRCKGASRYGVKPYHEKSLLETANESSDSAHFGELLAMFKASYFAESPVKKWEGSATELQAAMLQDDGIRDIVRTYSSRAIGRALGKLAGQGSNMKASRAGAGGGRVWTIFK